MAHREQLQRDPEPDLPGLPEPAVGGQRGIPGEAREGLERDRAPGFELEDGLKDDVDRLVPQNLTDPLQPLTVLRAGDLLDRLPALDRAGRAENLDGLLLLVEH